MEKTLELPQFGNDVTEKRPVVHEKRKQESSNTHEKPEKTSRDTLRRFVREGKHEALVAAILLERYPQALKKERADMVYNAMLKRTIALIKNPKYISDEENPDIDFINPHAFRAVADEIIKTPDLEEKFQKELNVDRKHYDELRKELLAARDFQDLAHKENKTILFSTDNLEIISSPAPLEMPQDNQKTSFFSDIQLAHENEQTQSKLKFITLTEFKELGGNPDTLREVTPEEWPIFAELTQEQWNIFKELTLEQWNKFKKLPLEDWANNWEQEMSEEQTDSDRIQEPPILTTKILTPEELAEKWEEEIRTRASSETIKTQEIFPGKPNVLTVLKKRLTRKSHF